MIPWKQLMARPLWFGSLVTKLVTRDPNQRGLVRVPCDQFGLGIVQFLDEFLGTVRGIVIHEEDVEIGIEFPDGLGHIHYVSFLIVSRYYD